MYLYWIIYTRMMFGNFSGFVVDACMLYYITCVIILTRNPTYHSQSHAICVRMNDVSYVQYAERTKLYFCQSKLIN